MSKVDLIIGILIVFVFAFAKPTIILIEMYLKNKKIRKE